MARGTIQQVRPGTWRLRAYVGLDPETGHPRQISKTVHGSKREAEVAMAELVADVARGDAVLSKGQTVAEALDAWLEFITPQRQPGTIRGYRDKARRINAAVGHVRLDRLTAQDLDRAYARWLEEGASPATVHHCHRVLSACLHQAQRWGIVTRVVTELARPPKVPRLDVPIVDQAAWQALIERCQREDPSIAVAVILAGVTGCRRGELCGLRWSDLDAERGVLTVSRAVRHELDKRSLVVGPTKTHQTRRLSVDAHLLAVLARHRDLAERRAQVCGVDLPSDAYILSPDADGAAPMRPDTLTSAFHRISRDAGVQLRLHDLRHMSASLLIAAGVDVRTTAGRLGHADASTTLRIYAHVLEAQDRRAADLLGAALAASGDMSRPSAASRAGG